MPFFHGEPQRKITERHGGEEGLYMWKGERLVTVEVV
jgi:hypothetical protein